MITEFALFVFTTLGGVGAGLYVAAAAFPVNGKRSNVLVALVPLVCLAVGGVALLLHLGHPERMFNAFANPQAGITMEAFASMAFGVVLVVDFVLTIAKGSAPRLLRIVGAALGIVLCIVMGLTYFNYESVAAWHAGATIPFFLLVDMAVGFALWGALSEGADAKKAFDWICLALLVVAAVLFLVEGMPFGAHACGIAPFACAAALVVAAAVCVYIAGKKQGAGLYWAAFAFAFVAMVVARYAFYSII